ncbi:hypothetical protein WICPIJ_001487 [Wickerhamomyces pijperi]|uniref:Uncharacterized protein n=1 Tax=Wickerhamomyces pijperi TaxID=599730 RepID=A0A9P8QD64_WICPI|nr:hypothetical protein WICPIJ_001487 [Wickerhamomyces pijperi]
MIILNNTLFACRPCIILDHGQGCTHVANQGGLFSLSESILLKKPHYQTQPFIRQGDTFRLVVCTPEVKDTITVKHVEDQELLFNKFLNVNTKKKIGKQIFILNKETPALLQPTADGTIQMNISRIMHSMNQTEPFVVIRDADKIPKDMIPAYNQIIENAETAPVVIRPLQKAKKRQTVQLVKSIIGYQSKKSPKISTNTDRKPKSSVSFADSICDIEVELAEREAVKSRANSALKDDAIYEEATLGVGPSDRKYRDLRYGEAKSEASQETQNKTHSERSTQDNTSIGKRFVFGPNSTVASLTGEAPHVQVATKSVIDSPDLEKEINTQTKTKRSSSTILDAVSDSSSDDDLQALIDEIKISKQNTFASNQFKEEFSQAIHGEEDSHQILGTQTLQLLEEFTTSDTPKQFQLNKTGSAVPVSNVKSLAANFEKPSEPAPAPRIQYQPRPHISTNLLSVASPQPPLPQSLEMMAGSCNPAADLVSSPQDISSAGSLKFDEMLNFLNDAQHDMRTKLKSTRHIEREKRRLKSNF